MRRAWWFSPLGFAHPGSVSALLPLSERNGDRTIGELCSAEFNRGHAKPVPFDFGGGPLTTDTFVLQRP